MAFACAQHKDGFYCIPKDEGTKSSFRSLQTELNRFATSIGRPGITVTGAIGTGTQAAVGSLGVVAMQKATPTGSLYQILVGPTPENVAGNADALASFFKAARTGAPAGAAAGGGAAATPLIDALVGGAKDLVGHVANATSNMVSVVTGKPAPTDYTKYYYAGGLGLIAYLIFFRKKRGRGRR